MPRSRQLKLSVFDDPVLADLGHGEFRLLLAIWQLCDASGWAPGHSRAIWRHAFSMGSTTQPESDKLILSLVRGGHLIQEGEGFRVPSFRLHNSVHPREEKALAGTRRDLPGLVPPCARRDLSESSSVSVQEEEEDKSTSVQALAHAYAEDWNSTMAPAGAPVVRNLTRARRVHLRAREKEGLKDEWPNLLEQLLASKTWWSSWGRLTFDWVIKNSDNWVKIVEGAYRDDRNGAVGSSGLESLPDDHPSMPWNREYAE